MVGFQKILVFTFSADFGRGGGASGRAVAFCPSRLGSILGTDLAFFRFRIAANLFSLGAWLFLKKNEE